MAISKMKKLTLLAEQENKDQLLQSIQQLQSVEVIPLPKVVEESIVDDFEVTSSRDEQSDNDQFFQDAEYALDYLSQFVPKPGLIASLKAKREVLTLKDLQDQVDLDEIQAIIDRVSEKEDQLNKVEEDLKALREEEAFFRRWKKLSHHPKELKEFDLLEVILGSVDEDYIKPFKEAVEDLDDTTWQEVYSSKESLGLYVITPKDQAKSVRSELAQSGFRELNYKYDKLPEEELKDNQDKRAQLVEERKAIKKDLRTWKDEKRSLELAIEFLYNKGQRIKAKDLVLNSQHLFLASGWIEADQVDLVTDQLNQDLEDNVAVIPEDVMEEEYDDVPVVLKNNGLVKPFEMLIEMFSYPKYGGLDPTPWIAPFYFIFFGMMSADAGYGLLLFLVTFAGLKIMDLGPDQEQNIRFFMYNTVATIILGLIFGSFFGFELPFQVLNLQDDVITVLIISIILGVIHIILGFQLDAYFKHKDGDHLQAYIDDHSWSMIIIGAVVFAAGLMLGLSSIVENIGIALIVINAIGIVIASMITGSNIFVGFGQGLLGLTDVAGITGDIVSYSRIMALGVASANIGMAFNLLVSVFPPVVRFTLGIIVFIALHFLNIFIAFLGAYVHSLRLHFVEMFGKFYTGGGRKLEPLGTLQKYIWIKK